MRKPMKDSARLKKLFADKELADEMLKQKFIRILCTSTFRR